MHDTLLEVLLGILAIAVTAGVGQMFRLGSAMARLEQRLEDHISTTTAGNGNLRTLVSRLEAMEGKLEAAEMRFVRECGQVKRRFKCFEAQLAQIGRNQ